MSETMTERAPLRKSVKTATKYGKIAIRHGHAQLSSRRVVRFDPTAVRRPESLI